MTTVAALEGSLPPCKKLATFEGWQAVWWDSKCECGRLFNHGLRFHIGMGPTAGWWEAPGHKGLVPFVEGDTYQYHHDTDDPEEAERLWLEACERLREVAHDPA